MDRRNLLRAGAASVAAWVLPGCGGKVEDGSNSGGGGGGGSDTLLARLQQDGSFPLWLAALDKAGLAASLDAMGAGLTVFAAEDTAFDRLASRLGHTGGQALIDALSAAQWTDILNFQQVRQELTLAQLDDLAANDSRPSTLFVFDGDAAQLIFVDNNGTLNIWDGVGRSSITVPRGDIVASNGMLHVTSDLLLPRHVLTVTQMLRANVDAFSDYASYMTPAVIAELDGSGPFTVFVPINGTITAALSESAVRHHVTNQLLSGDAFPTTSTGIVLTMLAGQDVTLRRSLNGPPTLSYGTTLRARVTDGDFFASNGVIHVIDAVLP